MATKAQIKAVRRYDDANTIKVALKLNKKTDADVIQRLQECGNKQGYIKKLIRADLG